VIDATGKLVVPGLIACHTEIPSGNEAGTGQPPGADAAARIRAGLWLLLRHGVTTVVAAPGLSAGDAALAAEAADVGGLRFYGGPTLGRGLTGPAGIDLLADYFRRHHDSAGGRVLGHILLDPDFTERGDWGAIRGLADRWGVGLSIRLGDHLYDFHRTLRGTGGTPVALLAAEGLLTSRSILGPARLMAGHRHSAYPHGGDLEAIAAAGATVAHAPLELARAGQALESLDRYLEQGVRLAFGASRPSFDLLSDLRCAALAAKIVDRNHEAGRAAVLFDAVTVAAADALGRKDLGRLAPRARADLVIIDLERLRVGPVYDPIRALIHCAHGAAVEHVVVAGRLVVANGKPTGLAAPSPSDLADTKARAPLSPWMEGA
jgi:cytosine/adenosine deaminase-related metal-dependent hydrolase